MCYYILDTPSSSAAPSIGGLLRAVTCCALTLADTGNLQASAAFHLTAAVLHMALHEQRPCLSKFITWHLHETLDVMPKTEILDNFYIFRGAKHPLSSWADNLLCYLEVCYYFFNFSMST